MDSLTDIKVNRQRDVETDDTNDLAVVSGIDNVQQSVGNNVSDITQALVGTKLTGARVGALEQGIEDALEDDPQVGTVGEVTVTEFNKQTNTVRASVTMEKNEDFKLEMII